MTGRLARQQARRQQRERIAGVVVVALGVLVLVVAIFALREPNGHVSSAGAAATSSSNVAHDSSSGAVSAPPSTRAHSSAQSQTSDAHGGHQVTSVPLVVLNNSTTTHLARDAAQQFESGGWTVTRFTNYPGNDILSTCAYYDPSYPGAQAAAQALRRQFPQIQRTKPKFDGLPSGPIVVILTQGYTVD